MDGMETGEKIDIQPSATSLHDTFQLLGTDGHPGLAQVKKSNGDSLVPAGVSKPNIDAAQKALIAISTVITGNTDEVLEQQHIYKSTSKHLARQRSAGAAVSSLGKLTGNTGKAFCIGFQNGLTFQSLTPEQLRDRKANTALLPSGSDWFDDIGDFFEDVSNGLYNAIDCVVDAVGDTVKGTITFIVDGVTKAWDFILEVASQAAELASVVFEYIKVSFDDLFAWLGWFFDWNDICKTQDALITMFDTASKNVGVSTPISIARRS